MSLFVSMLLCAASAPGQEPTVAKPSFDHRHTAWTAVLKDGVRGDRFDYAAVKRDSQALDHYLAQLESVEPGELRSWTAEQQMAFWINAYNAYTVSLVSRGYPIEKIQDLGDESSSVWEKKFVPLEQLHSEGRAGKLSLDEIEHRILRPVFRDARVHAAVHCASESCPALLDEAYVAERLDAQLDAQARRWLADPSLNRFDPGKNAAQISEIFKWFADDFARDAGSVLKWMANYAPEPAMTWLAAATDVEIGYLEYSWTLNAAENP